MRAEGSIFCASTPHPRITSALTHPKKRDFYEKENN